MCAKLTCMYRKSTMSVRGTTATGSSESDSEQLQAVPIVNVFPLPVCPYARIVALKPCGKGCETGIRA